MTRIAYVNGRYLPLARATAPVEDRGLQFADGVYEVIKVVGGAPLDLERHLDRLERSLAELRIGSPAARGALRAIVGELLRRNRLRDALVYLQVDRGAAPRNHLFPKTARPTLMATVRRVAYPRPDELARGVGVVTLPDERWARCDVKSVSLLPNVLARQRAAEAGCREAWLHDADGMVTEGSSSNAYVVDGAGRLVTRPLGRQILGGITRAVVLEIARARGVEVIERAFSVAEAREAREAFLTSTSSLVLPVTRIDGRPVGEGVPGPVTLGLQRAYLDRAGLAQLLPA